MAILYRIYSNRGTGGPVDYSTPLAATPGLTYVAGPISPVGDSTFVVRAFDPGTNIEEANTGARVRVVTGADGRDVSTLPNPPHALAVTGVSGGGCRVDWAYVPSDSYGAPIGFNVYLPQGPPAGAPSPAGVVRSEPGKVGYTLVLPGPFPVAAYTATVKAFNAAGEGAGAPTATAELGLQATPFAVDQLRFQYI